MSHKQSSRGAAFAVHAGASSYQAISRGARKSVKTHKGSTAPPKGEPRAKYKSTQHAKTKLRHSEEGEARRGNPFSFKPQLVFGLS